MPISPMPDLYAVVKRDLEARIAEVPTYTQLPGRPVTALPYNVIDIGGGDTPDPRFAARPMVQVDSYAATRKAARELAEAVRVALLDAWLHPTPLGLDDPPGRIGRVRIGTWPDEIRLPDQADSFARWSGTYQITFRP